MGENQTRRRVLQSAGIIGITGLVGSSVAAGQETDTPTTEGALRVAHASPDAPEVDVRLDDQTVAEGVGFGTVTDYETVEAGDYQLQVLAAEDGILGGFLEDLFGQNESGDTVLFEQQVTIEEEATLTAVAFGLAEAVETPTETATPTETETATPTGTQTPESPSPGQGAVVTGLPFGEAESFTVEGGAYRLLVRPTEPDETTPTDGVEPDGGTATASPETDTETETLGGTGTPTEADARPFDVALLEDDLSSPEEGQSRVRVFHAVPDLDEVTVVAVPQEQGDGPPEDAGQGDGPPEDAGQDGAAGNQGQPPEAGTPPASAEVTLEPGTVYAGFAVGYATLDEETETPETETLTPDDGAETETTTGGTETGTPEGERPAFEFLLAETAVDGERVDGGGTE